MVYSGVDAYETDDFVGMGDLKTAIAKLQKGAKKFGKFVRKVRGKIRGARVTAGGKTVSVTDSGQVAVMPAEETVAAVAPGGIAEFVKKNPILLGVGALAVFALLMRRR